jgi:uncharacterized membrane protein YbhN (UPF0104 family)
MAIVNLAILIPNAPGGIGIFELVGVLLLAPMGIAKESATGYMLWYTWSSWSPSPSGASITSSVRV